MIIELNYIQMYPGMKFLVLIPLLLSLRLFSQQTEEKFEFSIFFGDCFNNDTINLKLNGRSILTEQKLKTNPIGYAGCNVIQFEKNLVIHCMDTAQKFSKIPLYEFLQIGIAINKLWSYHNFDVSKGKFILIENCGREEQNNKFITLRQMNEPPEFLTKQ